MRISYQTIQSISSLSYGLICHEQVLELQLLLFRTRNQLAVGHCVCACVCWRVWRVGGGVWALYPCMSVSSPAVSKSSLRTMRSDEHLRANAAQLSDCCVCVSVCLRVQCGLLDSCRLALAATSTDTARHVHPSRAAHRISLCMYVCLGACETLADPTAQDCVVMCTCGYHSSL